MELKVMVMLHSGEYDYCQIKFRIYKQIIDLFIESNVYIIIHLSIDNFLLNLIWYHHQFQTGTSIISWHLL